MSNVHGGGRDNRGESRRPIRKFQELLITHATGPQVENFGGNWLQGGTGKIKKLVRRSVRNLVGGKGGESLKAGGTSARGRIRRGIPFIKKKRTTPDPNTRGEAVWREWGGGGTQ